MKLKLDLTPGVRQVLYIGFFVLVLTSGALDIVYDANPMWLTKGDDVLNYLGGALMLTAASNIAKTDPAGPTVIDNSDYVPERALNEDDSGI